MATLERKALLIGSLIALGAVMATAATVPLEAQQAEADRLAYGKHLSQECTTCHRRDGTDKGIPSIIGLAPDYFVSTMKFYQTGARTNPTMNSVAQMLSEEQLQALATYFHSLKPPAKQPGKKK